MPRTISYYFSASSPWTMLGHDQFMALVAKHKLAVAYHPIRLADVFAETGGVPLPKRAQARKDYRMHELKRWRDYHDIQINLEPTHFPVDDQRANQLINYAEDQMAEVAPLVRAIGRAVWLEDKNIDDPEVLRAILVELGDDPNWVEEAAEDEEAADRITRESKQAIEAGVIGAPCYVFRGEPFWGQDRLDLLSWHLDRVFQDDADS
ncbi:MAG: 2-hydroxychromene-2-carboxylate isomerase [Alphaproteobacteria bacterium]|nr:2-hydroxychromene-2-carboxylate isomerase [Alphaproteobacteria bacterium SS10]